MQVQEKLGVGTLSFFADAGVKHNGNWGGKQQARIAVHDGQGIVVDEVIGDYTSNQAEILAIRKGLELLEAEGGGTLYSDSQIAVNLVNRRWRGKNPVLKLLTAGTIVPGNCEVVWVPREINLAGHYIEAVYSV